MVLIWKQIRDGSLREFCQHCQIEPSWDGSRNVQHCPDLLRVPRLGFSGDFPGWVISSTVQVLTASEGSGAGTWQQLQATLFKFNQQAFGGLVVYFMCFRCVWFSEAELAIS